MLVGACDPGESPGWCAGWYGAQAAFSITTELTAAWRELEFDLFATELQFQAPGGRVSRGGKKLKVSAGAPLALAFTAGFQLAQPKLSIGGRRLGFEPRVWRGLLWADGASGLFGLSKQATLERLRARAPELLRGRSEDECEAFGLWLAACAVGLAKKGTLLDGQPWALKRKPWGFKVSVPKAAKSSARRWLKGRKP